MWNSGGGEVLFGGVEYSGGDRMCRNSGYYDVWLGEPRSVRERREMFLSRMGFVEPEIESCGGGDSLMSERRRSNGEANFSGDYSSQDWSEDAVMSEIVVAAENCEMEEVADCVVKCPIVDKTTGSWWRRFTRKMKRNRGANVSAESKLHVEGGKLRIEQNRKRYMECTSVHAGQEINAHDGLIWTMKFSPDGQYLASGGADGVVCIWRVTSCPTDKKCSYGQTVMEGKHTKRTQASVVVPEMVLRIEEEPLHKFQGHKADVLDLAWSKTNHLLSSSMDKTVRLWQAGSDECLAVFQHSNYVTCVQFNPIDENCFISGSIDGKVRIWGIERRRVEDWANVRDIVTAVCYQPDGKGFVAGSVSGNCRFYEISDDELVLNAVINVQGKRKSSGNRITGIQFLENDSQRVMITSEDSKIRIIDGLEIVHKYKGLAKSGCQMSASFTTSGSHIVSVGEDSRIYLWNYEEGPSTTIRTTTTKQAKSTRSCESFFLDGVSVAIPWSNPNTTNNYCCACREDSPASKTLDPERFSLANWFSMDASSRSSITWPEEKLPVWDYPSADHDDRKPCNNASCGCGSRIASTAWGLVFVTANGDGTMRTFHNFGLPARI